MTNMDTLMVQFTKATEKYESAYMEYLYDSYSNNSELAKEYVEFDKVNIALAHDTMQELIGKAKSLGNKVLLNKMKATYEEAKNRVKVAKMEAKLRRF